jgi:hypothetical protein
VAGVESNESSFWRARRELFEGKPTKDPPGTRDSALCYIRSTKRDIYESTLQYNSMTWSLYLFNSYKYIWCSLPRQTETGDHDGRDTSVVQKEQEIIMHSPSSDCPKFHLRPPMADLSARKIKKCLSQYEAPVTLLVRGGLRRQPCHVIAILRRRHTHWNFLAQPRGHGKCNARLRMLP